MTPPKKQPRSQDKVWRHAFNNVLYGLSQAFEGTCQPKADLNASRALHELSIQKVQELFEEILNAVPANAGGDSNAKDLSKAQPSRPQP